ncbi:MAG: hypothetical protein HC849_25490 [Oscillatoriales cyanobacterium RU_3_3]|nr:hypothetical protein [Oscillatoriales cyanobacterium RU_3_3]
MLFPQARSGSIIARKFQVCEVRTLEIPGHGSAVSLLSGHGTAKGV